MTIKKSTKLMLALVGALSVAAPLALSATPAEAAPQGSMMLGGGMHDNRGHVDIFHDRSHRPPLKTEYRPRQPHGHYNWRAGNWTWSHNQWTWAPGIWVRF